MVRASTRRKHHTRRSSGGIGTVTPVKAAVTAAAIGLAEKSGLLDKLPEIPWIGRKGAIALLTYYWARHGGGQIARDVCLVASALCGYEYGKEGSISG
jgi:hypothetical protein